MHRYQMVLTPAYFDAAKRGAFDHWKGETVPLRGPDRKVIGEATVTDVDHRENGSVHIVIESKYDDITFTGLARIAELLRGRNSMSFRFVPPEPHRPQRDDDVARWLKDRRSQYDHDVWDSENLDDLNSYQTINSLLDEYRARADFGLTLDAPLSELPDGW